MELKDFDYDLPERLIAQRPAERRDSSRLMVVERATGAVSHRRFSDITGLLRAGDLLVLNDTRVVPARLFGRRSTGGAVELLVVRTDGPDEQGRERFSAMINPSRRLRPGVRIVIGGEPGEGAEEAEVTGRDDEGFYLCRLTESGASVRALLDACGSVPLPPYIGRAPGPEDAEQYQTVFAAREGAVAAPTAGLHFTSSLLARIREAGVDVRFVTLHTGPGTFMPVRTDDIRAHRMHKERYEIPPDVFDAVRLAKAEGRRVIAVGSTSTRALESAALGGLDHPVLSGDTALFVHPETGEAPGARFRVVDAMITNFHLPRSTLVMLVAAFAGLDLVRRAYSEAIREGYRFYSYGDAMMIV